VEAAAAQEEAAPTEEEAAAAAMDEAEEPPAKRMRCSAEQQQQPLLQQSAEQLAHATRESPAPSALSGRAARCGSVAAARSGSVAAARSGSAAAARSGSVAAARWGACMQAVAAERTAVEADKHESRVRRVSFGGVRRIVVSGGSGREQEGKEEEVAKEEEEEEEKEAVMEAVMEEEAAELRQPHETEATLRPPPAVLPTRAAWEAVELRTMGAELRPTAAAWEKEVELRASDTGKYSPASEPSQPAAAWGEEVELRPSDAGKYYPASAAQRGRGMQLAKVREGGDWWRAPDALPFCACTDGCRAGCPCAAHAVGCWWEDWGCGCSGRCRSAVPCHVYDMEAGTHERLSKLRALRKEMRRAAATQSRAAAGRAARLGV
jgi:hypothetical protein